MLIAVALITCLSSATFAEIKLHVSIDSVAAVEGDSLCVLTVRLDNPSDTVEGFALSIQMNNPDYAEFRPVPIDSQETLISGWEFLHTNTITPQYLKIIGLSDNYPGGPSTHTPGIAPQTGGILLRLLVRMYDHVILPMDSTVVFVINYQMLDLTNFSDEKGQLIGTMTTMQVDSSYFDCTQWDGTTCLNWVRTADPQSADSIAVDTILVTNYDPALARFDNGKIQVLFRSGDANGNHAVNVADAVYLINYVFKSGPQPPMRFAGDCNCDVNVNIGDAVQIINCIFKGAPLPRCLH